MYEIEKELWKKYGTEKKNSPENPLIVASSDGRLFVSDGEKIICLTEDGRRHLTTKLIALTDFYGDEDEWEEKGKG